MPKSRVLIAILASLSLALFAAACGADDGGDDEGEITEAIEQAATSDTAERCTERQTGAFNQQSQFEESEEAGTEACEGTAGDGDVPGESVEVSNIEVDGDSATAEVAFTGGSLDRQVIAMGLVKEDDQWKLDSFDEFVSFDQAAFTQALVAQASADDETPQQVVDCVEQTLTAADPEQIQSAYLSGDENELVTLFGTCFGGE